MASQERSALCGDDGGEGHGGPSAPTGDKTEAAAAGQLSRRGMLGVLAAGAALVACGPDAEQSSLVSGPTTSVKPLAGSQATSATAKAKPVLLEVEVDAATRALNDSLATVELESLPAEAFVGPANEFGMAPEIVTADDMLMPFDESSTSVTAMPSEDQISAGEGGGSAAADTSPSPMDDASMGDMSGPGPMDDMSGAGPTGDMAGSTDDIAGSMDDTAGSMDDMSGAMYDKPLVVDVDVDETIGTAPTPDSPATTVATAPAATATTVATELQPTGNGSLTASLVINKLTFGPKQGQVARVQSSGPAAFVEDQLRRTGPDPAVEKAVKAIKPIHYSPKGCVEAGLRNWWMGQYVTHVGQYRNARSEHQLFEMMCHLWMDHFSVFLSDYDAFFIPDYQEKVIRPNAMGTFKDLLKATAHSAAMLTYLDNVYNDASTTDGINENYGRELLELHTLGIDRNERQVYNEQDVRTVSTVMGGWSAGRNRRDLDSFGKFVYRPEREYGDADLSILNGAWSTAGLSGKQRGDSLLEFLATHPSTARNVSLRLCQRFVSDNPSQALVDSAADVFLSTDTSIVAVLRHIFSSDEFAASAGLKVRRPMEYEAALFRFVQTNIELVGYEGNDARSLRWYMKTGRSQEPWAWQQPDGYPDVAEYWIKTDGFYRRWHDANYAARGARWGNDLSSLLKAIGGRNAAGVVQEVATQVGLGSLTAEEVTTIAGAIGLDIESAEIAVGGRQLQALLALVMSHPRFQTR